MSLLICMIIATLDVHMLLLLFSCPTLAFMHSSLKVPLQPFSQVEV